MSAYGRVKLLNLVYTIQPDVKPVKQPVGQPVECLFTRCSRCFNRVDNRLCRVNFVLGSIVADFQSPLSAR